MSNYQENADKPTEFLALTGYMREEFDALLPHFSTQYTKWMNSHRLDGKPRGKRRYSAYKNSPLASIEEKLFFILSYVKTNNLQTVQGALFGMSQAKANLWIHCLHPILNQTLAEMNELPARQMADVPFDEEENTLYYHDGTERPIQRPCDPKMQRQHYSGKKTAYGQEQSPDQRRLPDPVSDRDGRGQKA